MTRTLALLALLGLVACETIQGAGRDLETAGEVIQDEAEDAKKRLFGFLNDVKHISVYSPFVDAMVVDQPMAAIVGDGRVNIANRYGTKIFSLNNWPDLLAWLRSLTDSISTEHRRGLEVAYP